MTASVPLDIGPYWQGVQDDMVRIVDLVPDGKLNFTPKPELWNSRGILIHVADARDRWLGLHVPDGDPYPNVWATARTKDDIRRELGRTWSRLQRFLANASALNTTYRLEWDGGGEDRTGHWVAFHLLEHDIHHRAELLQRLALLDIEHGIDI